MLDVKLLKALTWANLKSRYRNTFLGFLWVILNPIIVLFVQAFLFSIVFKIQHQNYFVFLMAGLLPWLFIVQSVDMCTGMFVSHANMIKNIPISPLMLLFTQILDNFINFLVSFLLISFLFFLQGKINFGNIIFYSIPIFLLLISVAALVVILTTLNVLFRDLKFVSSFILSLLFYLTPIFYPARYIPINFQFILDYNVFYYLLKPFQILSSSFSVVDFFQSLLGALSVSIILIIIAIYVWRKNRKYLVIYA
jgi:ABC-type polysaccharide/polyol phosphate export permease